MQSRNKLPKPEHLKGVSQIGGPYFEVLADEDYIMLVLAGYKLCPACNGRRTCTHLSCISERHGCATCCGRGVYA